MLNIPLPLCISVLPAAATEIADLKEKLEQKSVAEAQEMQKLRKELEKAKTDKKASNESQEMQKLRKELEKAKADKKSPKDSLELKKLRKELERATDDLDKAKVLCPVVTM